MNWGTKLIVGMLCFMFFIIMLGILMIGSKPDPLVDEDYYEKGLNFDRIKSMEEARKDSVASAKEINGHE